MSLSSTSPKAFLCSQDGTVNYPIAKKITTIGRSNCDINLNTNIDDQHALIEYIDDENCFILQDLNTSVGTYVNECRIQNAAVRLIEQDTIRFGPSGEPFQFIVQPHFTTIPPINLNPSQRQSTISVPQQLQIITQTVPSRSLIASGGGGGGGGGLNGSMSSSSSGTSLYVNPLPNGGSLITINNQTVEPTTAVMTKPAAAASNLRSRPISASGSGGGSGSAASPAATAHPLRRFSKETSATTASSSTSAKVNVWAKGIVASSSNHLGGSGGSAICVDVIGVQQPQPQFENDTYRLPQEIAENNGSRVNLLEREIKVKTKEIRELREKLAFYQSQSQTTSVSVSQPPPHKSTTTSLNTTLTELSNELEQLKRDKQVAVTQVTKLQRDLTSKDVSISRLGREIEALRRDLKSCECSTSARTVTTTTTATKHHQQHMNDEKKSSFDWRRVEEDELVKEKTIAVGLVNQMQKDLAAKDVTLTKMAREIDAYKRQLKEYEALRKELEDKLKIATDKRRQDDEQALKEKELVVLRSKFKATEQKVIDLTNKVGLIKNELDESQKQTQKQAMAERKLKEELEHAKNQFLDMQSAERVVRIDLEQMKRAYESFRNMIVQAIYSTPGIGQPSSGEVTNEDLAAKWKEITRERNYLYETIDSLKKSVATQEKSNLEIDAAIKQLELQLESSEGTLSTEGRRTEKIETQVNALKRVQVGERLSRLRDLVINAYSNEICWESEIESTLLSSFSIDINNSDSIVALLARVKSQMDAMIDEKAMFESKMSELEQAVEKRVNDTVESRVAEVTQAKLDALEAEKDELYRTQISELEAKNKEFIELIKSDFNTRIDQITEEKNALTVQVESLNETLTQLNEEVESKTTESNQAMAFIKSDHEITQNELKAQLEQYESKINEYTSKIEELTSTLTTSEENYSNELTLFKEQVKQHSLTIVELEKEISRLKEEKVETVKHKKEANHKANVQQTNAAHFPVVQTIKVVDNTHEVESLGRTIDLLRGECQTYKIRLSEQDELVKALRRELSMTAAKLTDVQGEMTEKQKRELEKNRQLVVDLQRDLSESRSQLSKLSKIIDEQTKQMDALKAELGKSKSLVDKYRQTSEENGLLSIELKTKLDEMEGHVKKFECVKKEEGKITSELSALGAQCKGERHEQVIARQREALAELRQRAKALEAAKPATSQQQQQMQQQIMLLKKQLAEVRASQALSDDIAKHAQLVRSSGTFGGSGSGVATDHASLMVEEKTAHYETQVALEACDEAYLRLLKTLAAILEMSEIDGLRSMSGLSAEERDLLLTERNKSIETICLKIKNLHEKIQRKDELLREYELDLARLRQAEFILQKKSEQLDEIQVLARSKEEELEYLKETLKSTKSELEREKQLNTAIKEKRPLTSVNAGEKKVRRGSTDTLHHHCPPGDSKAAAVKKEMGEKIKRKDYELKTLKSEIKSKVDEISNLTSRLTIVENNQPK